MFYKLTLKKCPKLYHVYGVVQNSLSVLDETCILPSDYNEVASAYAAHADENCTQLSRSVRYLLSTSIFSPRFSDKTATMPNLYNPYLLETYHSQLFTLKRHG